MRQDASFFEGKEPALIYIAKRLKDALRLESLLTGAGIDYHVEVDNYRGGLIFQTERTGAFFYVLPGSQPSARHLMATAGFRPFEPE